MILSLDVVKSFLRSVNPPKELATPHHVTATLELAKIPTHVLSLQTTNVKSQPVLQLDVWFPKNVKLES